jgi:hypothetical protein
MIRKYHISLAIRFLLCALSFIFLLSETALAQNGLPPLIDREILSGNPEIARAQISPDGKFIAFLKPHQDTLNMWVKRADAPFANARLLTNEAKRPIRNFFWSRDGKFILFVNDKGGDENFNDPSSGLPIYLQIVQQIKTAVAMGRLQPENPLPSVR